VTTNQYPGRRKALKQAQSHLHLARAIYGQTEVFVPCWSEDDQATVFIPASSLDSRLRDRRNPILPYTTTPTKLDRVQFPLCPDHLLTLLQYNVLRACLWNRDLISRLQPQQRDYSSTSLVVLPDLDFETLYRLLPQSLHPTFLQRSIPHAAWIDILPHPVLRDNLICLTTSNGSSALDLDTNESGFDEEALWTDTVGGLFEGFTDGEVDYVGGIVWDSPWDVSGWEVSEGFWRKYGWLFRGCEPEALSATNRWRRIRGEEELIVGVR